MEVEEKSENPGELIIDFAESMEIEVKTENKKTKRNRAEDLEFYVPSPAKTTLSIPEIRELIFYDLNEKDQESMLLTTLDGHQQLLKIYAMKNAELNIKEWDDLPGLSSRMNYGLSKTTATFLGLFNNIYQKRGKEIDRERFGKIFELFEGWNHGNKKVILQDYTTLLKTLVMNEKPASEKMDILKNPIRQYLKEETKKNTLLSLYKITANETNFFNEKAIYIHYCIFAEKRYAKLAYQNKNTLDEIKETAVYAEDTFLMLIIKNLLLCENIYDMLSFSRNIRDWDGIITLDPGATVDVFISAAKAHLSAKNYALSSKYYDRVIELRGVNATDSNYTTSGDAHYKAKNFEQAAIRFDKALELLGVDATGDDYTNAGNAYYKLKNLEQAIKYYEKTLELQGNNAPYIYYINAGDAHFKSGNFEQAAKYYDEGHLKKIYNSIGWAKASRYINAGHAHYQLKNFNQAAKYYDKAIGRLDYKADINVHVCGGNAHFFSQNYKRASLYYDKILSLKGNKATAHDFTIAGDINFNLKKFQQAAEHYDKAIKLRGFEAGANDYTKAGDAHFKAHDFQQAAEHYDKALELRGVNATADDYRNAGDAHHLANNFEQAAQRFDKALELRGVEATILDYTKAGDANYDLQNFEQAAKHYDKALGLKGNMAEAKDYVGAGYAHFKTDNFKQAAEHYDKALELQGDNAKAEDYCNAIAAHGCCGNFEMVKKYIRVYFEKSDSINVDLIVKTMTLFNEGKDEEAFGLFVIETQGCKV